MSRLVGHCQDSETPTNHKKMLGKLIGKTIRIATLPLDAASAGMDMLTGGSGSKRSRTNPNDFTPLGDLERLRDRIAEAAEDIDDD